ncbi:hypothetical protein KMW28_08380 [Flammeovirga yaeyamensis]|uniref:Uncharacterized protein n=1 Tax=Flammeovirga yaeyamensis TaxID=367791 RepID=A0AAX1N7T0_9BACT|nr:MULTISPECIES: hypothetical protein [Flammeovirga]MBB3699023.1 hypothetical protein [Flammeovirga yaeyamensis]NMF36457.1 hypothetical protein [Flammeovirga yaeyamensis]QJD09414.1 hypothetical protein MY04_06305 [Flammeovirga sp. MY04]QWG03585.1 hypothetical protein KMW28_08380 [Flammeovirga yaeyamensis]
MSTYTSILDLLINKWILFSSPDYPSGKIKSLNILWSDYVENYQLQLTMELFNQTEVQIRIPLENNDEEFYIKLLKGSLGIIFDSEEELRKYLNAEKVI